MSHSTKPYRVVTPQGVAWALKFATEEGAWGRLLHLNGMTIDTQKNRANLEKEGWQVKLAQPALASSR